MLPPGIVSNHSLTHVTSGGETLAWRDIKETRFYTNAYVVHDGKVLVGYKKRGIGQGFYNGFGGKVEPNESSAEAAIRELEEEAGIRASLGHVGVLLFTTPEKPWAFHIDIYLACQYTGTPTETDEMRPEWFPLDQDGATGEFNSLPFDKMWEEDRHWIPLILAGKHFVGRSDFGYNEKGEATKLERWWIATHD